MSDTNESNLPAVPGNDVGPASTSADGAVVNDRRNEVRVGHWAVVVMPFGPDLHVGFENAEMVNCSASGIGLIMNRPLAANTRLFLKLKLSAVALIIYTVRYCKPLRSGYSIGAEFCSIAGNDADRECTPERVLAALTAL